MNNLKSKKLTFGNKMKRKNHAQQSNLNCSIISTTRNTHGSEWIYILTTYTYKHIVWNFSQTSYLWRQVNRLAITQKTDGRWIGKRAKGKNSDKITRCTDDNRRLELEAEGTRLEWLEDTGRGFHPAVKGYRKIWYIDIYKLLIKHLMLNSLLFIG